MLINASVCLSEEQRHHFRFSDYNGTSRPDINPQCLVQSFEVNQSFITENTKLIMRIRL